MEEKSKEELLRENEELRERLREAEEILDAIRKGEVDALAVSGAEGERVYTLEGADQVYRILMDTMNEGALTLSRDGTIFYGNLRFEQMSGVASTKLVGTSIFEFIPLEEREVFETLIERVGKDGSAKGEIKIRSANGATFPAGLSMNAVKLAGTEGFCILVSDMTVLKAHATRMEALNRELSEFVFVASHDLQEPLRKIQTFCSRIMTHTNPGFPDEATKDNLDRMQKSARRMQGLLHALTSYSLVSGRCKPLETVDLNEIARKVRLRLSDLIDEKAARVDLFDLPAIEADAGQMVILFENLVENALKFHGKEPPVVKIYSEVRGGLARIFIEDNGMGFDEHYLDRIFKPFQQLHARNRFEGTGMGLAICRKIVESHEGTITVESSAGIGSRFIVALPVGRYSPFS